MAPTVCSCRMKAPSHTTCLLPYNKHRHMKEQRNPAVMHNAAPLPSSALLDKLTLTLRVHFWTSQTRFGSSKLQFTMLRNRQRKRTMVREYVLSRAPRNHGHSAGQHFTIHMGGCLLHASPQHAP